MMAGIRGKDTKPERDIRKALDSPGFRYRLHVPDLPGKPDLVFPDFKAVLLIHGCYWHRHKGCWWCSQPKSNKAFWSAKFEQNVQRDKRNLADLEALGWRVAVVWECSLKVSGLAEVTASLKNWLLGSATRLVLPADQDKRPAASKRLDRRTARTFQDRRLI